MKLIYVAGAFSADTDEGRAANIAAAARAGEDVMKLGAAVWVPHLAWGSYYGKISERQAMDMCLEAVSRCDAVYVFDERHYATSHGTHEEAMRANSLRIPVFVSLARLKEWLDAKALVYGIGDVVLGTHRPSAFSVGKDLPWASQPRPK